MMALALVLGLSQCKKEQPLEPQGEQVRITLNVGNGGNNGSRVNVNPATSPMVTFEKGDKILVGYNGAYVGTLTHNGSQFEGSINATQNGDQPLYFYFVGNKQGTLEAGTTSCTVSISDQTNELPVLSMAPSNEDYPSVGNAYSASLHNQCALVKFPLANAAGSIKIGGMKNEATIDFASPSINPTESTGDVRLYSVSDTEKWAILLPQEAVSNAAVTIGSENLTVDVPAIAANALLDESISEIQNSSAIIDLDNQTPTAPLPDGVILKGTLRDDVQISIADGATVTLDNASINANGAWWSNYAGITCVGNATIILKDDSENTVRGFYEDYPGIYVPDGSTLTIKGGAAGTGKLTASSNGYGAGIGGGLEGDYEISCGNIEIQGGDITATGGGYAAGIGSGGYANCGTITISGGTVSATGGEQAAGIGSGSDFASCGTITISGGTVTANGGSHAAGIGSGSSSGAVCGDITINTGVTQVTATKGDGAPYSIGAGVDGTCDGTVTIGGVVFYDATNGYQNGYQALLQNSSFSVPPFSFTLTFGYEGSGDTEFHVFPYGETWEHLCHTYDAWRESIIMDYTWHVAKGQTTYVIQISDNGLDWATLEFNDESGHVIDPSKQYRWFDDAGNDEPEEPGGPDV